MNRTVNQVPLKSTQSTISYRIEIMWSICNYACKFHIPICKTKGAHVLACENIRFSSLFAAGDVSRGGTSATQRQKFHTDDANQCLLIGLYCHRVPNVNLFNLRFLLIDFGKVLCSSANELQQNSNARSREDYIPQILTVLLEIHHVCIWPLWPFVFCLSFINNS